jgi:hypothetical protein
VLDQQSRSLDDCYLVVWIDALVVKVRVDGACELNGVKPFVMSDGTFVLAPLADPPAPARCRRTSRQRLHARPYRRRRVWEYTRVQMHHVIVGAVERVGVIHTGAPACFAVGGLRPP